MRSILATLAAILFYGLSPTGGIAETLATQIKKLSREGSVVHILVCGPNLDQKSFCIPGSGFLAHTDKSLHKTFVFTAAHVLGEPSEWLDLSRRKIEVRRQAESGDMVALDHAAAVIAEDHDKDAAVLSIAEQTTPNIQVSASTHLGQGDALAMAGFLPTDGVTEAPRDVTFIPKFSTVRQMELAKFKIDIENPADVGLSGGPVIDDEGLAVGIISENNNRQNPRFHRATIVSTAVDLLNRYLGQFGSVSLPLQTHSKGFDKIRVMGRTGTAKTSIKGSNQALTTRPMGVEPIGSGKAAEVFWEGDEASPCDEKLGKVPSKGQATAILQPFELTGLRARFDLSANGGVSSNALMCLMGQAVGLDLHETEVVTSAEAEGTLSFEVITPLELRVRWQDLPEETTIDLIGPDQTFYTEINTRDANEQRVTISDIGSWKLRFFGRVRISARGPLARVQIRKQPLVFVEPL